MATPMIKNACLMQIELNEKCSQQVSAVPQLYCKILAEAPKEWHIEFDENQYSFNDLSSMIRVQPLECDINVLSHAVQDALHLPKEQNAFDMIASEYAQRSGHKLTEHTYFKTVAETRYAIRACQLMCEQRHNYFDAVAQEELQKERLPELWHTLFLQVEDMQNQDVAQVAAKIQAQINRIHTFYKNLYDKQRERSRVEKQRLIVKPKTEAAIAKKPMADKLPELAQQPNSSSSNSSSTSFLTKMQQLAKAKLAAAPAVVEPPPAAVAAEQPPATPALSVKAENFLRKMQQLRPAVAIEPPAPIVVETPTPIVAPEKLAFLSRLQKRQTT